MPGRFSLQTLLARESSSGLFIPEVDGLRFVAIASVVLYHLNGFVATKLGVPVNKGAVSGLLDKGNVGVQLFFVISGFIIALPFAMRASAGRAAPSLRSYFTRRLTRLEPPYLLNLVLLFTLLVVVKGASAAELFPHLVASAVYMHNLVYRNGSAINYMAWSLEIELQFYVLAPVFAAAFRLSSGRARRGTLVAATVLAAAVSAFVGTHGNLPLTILSFGQYFLTGFVLADLYVSDWRGAPEPSRAWDVASVLGWGLLVGLLFAPGSASVAIPVAIFLAYCGAFRGTMSRRIFRQPALYLVGGMCYTMYLYHFVIISTVGNRVLRTFGDPAWPVWVNLLIVGLFAVPAVLVGTAILFVATEKPFMRRDWQTRATARLRAGAHLLAQQFGQ